jgi:hypothetical protein
MQPVIQDWLVSWICAIAFFGFFPVFFLPYFSLHCSSSSSSYYYYYHHHHFIRIAGRVSGVSADLGLGQKSSQCME